MEYPNKPLSPPVLTPVSCRSWSSQWTSRQADEMLDRASLDAWDLTETLDELMRMYDGMPLAVAWRVVERRGVDISDLFGIVTASPHFKPRAASRGGRAARRPGRARPLAGDARQVWQHQPQEGAACLRPHIRSAPGVVGLRPLTTFDAYRAAGRLHGAAPGAAPT